MNGNQVTDLGSYREKPVPQHTIKISSGVKYSLFEKHLFFLKNSIQNLLQQEIVIDKDDDNDYTIFCWNKKKWLGLFRTRKPILSCNIWNVVSYNKIDCNIYNNDVLLLALNQFDLYREELNNQDSYSYDISIEMIKHF